MTLAPFVQPRRFPRGPAWQTKFLQHEAGASANLYDFVFQARIELDHFVKSGNLTASDRAFYRELQRQVASFARAIDEEAARWIEQQIPDAYELGAATHGPSVVIPRRALEALSGNSLGLIRNVTDEIRRDIRHTIAASILTGLNGQEVRARIVASGIGRGRWPSVEYRAGVIARTEILRAYNMGGLDAIDANGAQFARWIISPDEAVCPTCSPRHGVVYRLKSFAIFEGGNPYPGAKLLPKLPAHPRCRCTFAAVYRDKEGNIIGGKPAAVAPPEPRVPPKIADEPAVTPAAVDDFPAAIAKLGDFKRRYLAGEDVAADRQFWRSLDLDPDRRTQIAFMQDGQFDSVLLARYGARFDPKGPYDAVLKRAIIDGLERYRGVRPEWVTDSPYTKTIGQHSMNRPDLDPNVLGVAYADGRIAFDFEAISATGAYHSGRKVRIGPAPDEIALHEFAHALHNRFGAHDGYGYPAVEFGGRKISYTEMQAMTPEETIQWSKELLAAEKAAAAWKDGWAKARRASTGISPSSADVSAQIGMYRNDLIRLKEDLIEMTALVKPGGRFESNPRMLAFAKDRLAALPKQIAATQRLLDTFEGIAAKPVEMHPTEYAKTNEFEDFAESVTMYFLDPARLSRWSPKRYAFIRDSVFGGVEFLT